MSKTTCITTIVSEDYQQYIPLFLFFCLRSYPECIVKLFLTGKLNSKYREPLELIRPLGQFDLVENCFQGYPRSNQLLKAQRWMLGEKHFLTNNNVYVGDIDILICKEKPTLEEQHLSHCKETGLPYSNGIRRAHKDGKIAKEKTQRLSGLHFFKRKAYFESMGPVIDKYRKLLKEGKLSGMKNENILYQMIAESDFGFPTGWFRPHHGIHLRLWHKLTELPEIYWKIVGREEYKQYYEFYKMVEKESLYHTICKSCKLVEIEPMKRCLSKKFG